MARILLVTLGLEFTLRVGLALHAGWPALLWSARFTHYFNGFFGFVVALVATWGLLRDGGRFSQLGRITVAVTSALLLTLATMALSLDMPPLLIALMYAAFVLSLFGLLLASVLGTAPHMPRAGIFCMAVAPMLHAFALGASFYAAALPGALTALAAPAAGIGRAAAVLVGIPALMVARPSRPGRGAMTVAALVTITVAAALSWRPSLADAAFGIPVPTARVGQVLALASIFLATAALIAVWGRTMRRRAVGLGLGLVLLSGVVPTAPSQLLVVYAAFVLLVRGVASSAPEPSGWREYLSAVARQFGAGEPVVIALRDEEVSRLRAEQGPVDVRVVRCGDEIVQVDVATGDPPKGRPALSATHRRASQPRSGRLPEGAGQARVFGVADFDRRIVVKGEDASGWLDEEVRRLLMALPPGALAIWPGEGARWRSFPARTADPDRPVPLTRMAGPQAPPIEDLVGVVRVVREVARRAGVVC